MTWLSKFQQYLNPFSRRFSPAELAMFDFLRQNPLFETLSNEELLNFLPHLYERTFAKDEVIYFRNDPSQAFYMIKKGRVMLALDTQDSFEKLVTLSRYHYFGEDALLTRRKRNYNAVSAKDDTKVYAIPHAHLMEVFDDHPKMHAKISKALATVYEGQIGSIFRAYSRSFGFFDLGKASFADFLEERKEL
ncbi:MAG: cyclic nucleotide-binding domain-containing protein [Bacteroidota bacterium]